MPSWIEQLKATDHMIVISHGTMTCRRSSSHFRVSALAAVPLAALLLVMWPSRPTAQTLSHLRGVVITVDSTRLPDATVALMGTALVTRTDSGGRFAIAGVRP